MYTKSILIPVVTETPVSLPEYEWKRNLKQRVQVVQW